MPPIRLLTDGTIEFSCVEDAIAFCKPQKCPSRKVPPFQPKTDYQAFWEALTANSRAVLTALAGTPAMITTDNLAAESKVAALKLPPVIKSIRNLAAKCGLPEPFSTVKVSIAGLPKTGYLLNDAIREPIQPFL